VSGTGTGVVVGPLADIPLGEGRAYAVGPDQVAVFRLRDGSLRALSALCPHRGGPMADGQIDSAVVVCPLHLHAFDLATGCSTTGAPPLTTYRAFVDAAGMVAVEREGVRGDCP
jgi:nitrite reductase (NADH) small subunit